METPKKNPFTWAEIYVTDMSRAQKFYETILEIEMAALPIPEGMGEMQMVSFPFSEDGKNISGALVKMEHMNPGSGGTMLYFGCDDCSVEESRVENAGGKILQAKMSIGDYGFCSMIMDTEGNTVGLHSMA